MNPNTSISCGGQGERNRVVARRCLATAFLYNALPLDSVRWHDDSLPRAESLYNSVPLDSAGWHGDSPPETGFSRSRRASPQAHPSRPNLAVPSRIPTETVAVAVAVTVMVVEAECQFQSNSRLAVNGSADFDFLYGILFLRQKRCGNERSHRASASATRGWHDDSTPGAGVLYNSLPLDSAGWHGDPRQRLGSRSVAEHTCIARGSPVQTKHPCVEVPFPLGVLQDDGAIRARHEDLHIR